MKFIHISDVHLGQQPDAGCSWGAERGEELWEAFRLVIGVCNKEHADLLLIAGNLFHRQPLKKELKDVNHLFSTLERTKVVFIAGSCDYVMPNSYYCNYPWNDNVHFLEPEYLSSVYLEEIDTRVHGFSYHQEEILEHCYDEAVPVLSGGIQILLAHGGDDRHAPIDKASLGTAGFQYVALGYRRKPELMPELKMAYPGVLEPTMPSDRGQHGYVIGEIGNGKTRFQFVPFAKREYVLLRVKVTPEIGQEALEARLKETFEQNGSQNIYQIVLEGQYDAEAPLDIDRLYHLGLVLPVQDETIPDYDLEAIYEEHKDDIIGMYIQEFLQEPMTKQRRMALYAGLSVLMMQI